jgi:hypothetical protein
VALRGLAYGYAGQVDPPEPYPQWP